MPLQKKPTCLELQNRFSLQQKNVFDHKVKFCSIFDKESFGTMGMFIHNKGEQLVWDQFYPFGQTHEKSFRSDLLGIGIGTLAHTLVLLSVAEYTGKFHDATVRVYGAEGGFQKILERAGVPQCTWEEVSLELCMEGSLISCDSIGFDTRSYRMRIKKLMGQKQKEA